MGPSRRDVLRAGLYGGAMLATGPVWFPSRRAHAAPGDPAATLVRTIRRGPAGPGGYRPLVYGPGEPHVVRDELVPARPGRAANSVPLLTFAQLTDVHVVDAQSPGRVEFLDRYSDGATSSIPFDAAYRPQEMFTTQIADAMCRTLADLRTGPVTGRPIEFAISTGDNVDNAQYNEVRWFVDVLDGGPVTPNSGATDRWEGVHDLNGTTYDVHYWHPDGAPPSPPNGVDNARRLYGFPTVPGLLDAARRPFTAHGLRMPWYAVFGNHDPLLQGNASPNAAFQAILTGPLKVVGLAPGVSPEDLRQGLAEQDPAALNAFLAGPARPVTADPNRRWLTRQEIMAEHLVTTGLPVGHGFTQANVDADLGYYAFDHGRYVRCVVLDTVNPGGYADGSIDREQRDWLRGELDAAELAQKLVVLFSHHTSGTMGNPVLAPGETEQRILGPAVVELLLGYPNVVLWVNGHTHRNDVALHRATGGTSGFWEVNTAAHIDFPAQSRVIELVANSDGTLSIFATVVDLEVPLSYGSLSTPASLASLARELGANDWQQRTTAREGTPEVRNVELLLQAPVPLPGRVSQCLCAPPGDLPATGAEAPVAALALTAAALAAARWSGPRTDASIPS